MLADGRHFAISHSAAANDGELNGIRVAVLQDVTEARLAEAERRQMLEFLSHDMRAPQVAIISLAGLDGLADDAGDRLHRIRNHARRTLHLADTFVQLARLAEAPLSRDTIDGTMLIDEALDRAHGAAKAGTIKLSFTPPDEPLLLIGDGQVLSRVLDNLIGNAIRYCPAGSEVVLSAARQPGDADKVRLEISDDGPGLPEHRRADPFQRFGNRSPARGDQAQGDQAGSVGLGLAFVAEAVKRHHGTVVCHIEPNHGTRFSITLPAAPE
jgi:signal transduction histidine kinase